MRNTAAIMLGFIFLALVPARNGFAGEERKIPYYFMAVHMEANHRPEGASALIGEAYGVLREMVKRATAYHIKLTLMFTPQWADYLASDPSRMAQVKAWKTQGHEIAAHHHSIYHGNWDGYTDYDPQKVAEERLKFRAQSETYLGTLKDYMTALRKLDPEVRSGCCNDEADKKELPDGITYDTCSGFMNSGEAGQRGGDGNNPGKGINEYITVGTYKNIERKWLAHSQIVRAELEKQAERAFDSISSGVYGVVSHASANERKPFFAFLEFLRARDPLGRNSRTVAEVIDQKLIPEKKIPDELVNKKYVQGPPSGKGGAVRVSSRPTPCGDGVCDAFERSHPFVCPGDCPGTRQGGA